MLPDADVLAFKLGVAYGHVFGHRGFTHSLLFAFALPTLAMLFHRQLRARAATVWSFLLVSLLSHSLLDSLTTGGKGVGWLGGVVAWHSGAVDALRQKVNPTVGKQLPFVKGEVAGRGGRFGDRAAQASATLD